MTNGRKANVNLASRPLRNRRFYFAVVAAMAGTFILVAALATGSFLKNRTRGASARVSLEQLRQKTQEAQKEKDAWSAEIREMTRKDKDRIGAINGIILLKSFSWVDLLSKCEEALPPASYISSIAPLQASETRIDLRLRVVFPSLGDLFALIQKLNALGFKSISVKNEIPLAGQLTAEISFSHERTF
jgi:cell division protein FtsL